ncbi:hypothetical protein SAY86_000706 [Trapa natans]|uniref:Uncharacterized protein n=1 Tax=Trapa natans TaxID=22666 RepID=A0AAN7RN60_TRANT|nr:hypothetical protein SAY86_000706 [Trapa natans]
MGDFCEVEDDERFFDVREDSSDGCSSSPMVTELDDIIEFARHKSWIKCAESVRERRDRFLKWTGLSLSFDRKLEQEDSLNSSQDEIKVEEGRITESSGAVLRDFDYSFPCIHSLNLNQAAELSCDGLREGNPGARCKDFDGVEVAVTELTKHGRMDRSAKEIEPNLSEGVEELRIVSSYPSAQSYFHGRWDHVEELTGPKQRMKFGWLRRFGLGACVSRGVIDDTTAKVDDLEMVSGMKMRKVLTHSYKKMHTELSSLYAGQEFLAHRGSISTMKFSTDGRFLASSGDDAVVRVWRVTDKERTESIDISDQDASHLYFSVNKFSELAFLNADKESHLGKMKRIGRQSDSCCVLLPSKVWHIVEKPLHEFVGHSGEVLDLSWSKNGYLLSSSTDKTVRLWQVGFSRCLRVFSHNNYVTSINFNPVDEHFFISGSIDGKVRIWEVLSGRVVDYVNMTEIVSAVSYKSDGKGAIVGTLRGNCFFYRIEDNNWHLDAKICVHGGKKSPGKRITGFQFPPGDPSKIMVTSADSTIRILNDRDVVSKYKGLRSTGCHLTASFTSDGKHIISANEDSSVCIWNYTDQEKAQSRPKSILSCESFYSNHASIAIPWCGAIPIVQTEDEQVESPSGRSLSDCFNQKLLPFPSPSDCFSLGRGFLLELLPKGSATWPEEKLSSGSSPTSPTPLACRSEYKLLKSALSESPHLWGMVIVTAGWDGRIRTYHNYGLPVHS